MLMAHRLGIAREDNKPQRENEQRYCQVCTAQPKGNSSLAKLFRETGEVVGTTHTRTSPLARGPPPLQMTFLPPRRVNLYLTWTQHMALLPQRRVDLDLIWHTDAAGPGTYKGALEQHTKHVPCLRFTCLGPLCLHFENHVARAGSVSVSGSSLAFWILIAYK